MDWAVASNGEVQAWFFEDSVPRVVRCVFVVEEKRLAKCVQVMAGAQLKLERRSRAVHIAVDTLGERVFLADAKSHRVRAFDFSGKVIATSGEGELYFPNRLRLVDGGQLMVGDNDNGRLVWLDVSAQVPSFEVRKSLQSRGHPKSRSGRTLVTDAAYLPKAEGQNEALWVLAVERGQKNGDVLTYGDDLRPVGRAALHDDADPIAIDVLGDAALVADFNGIDLYRINPAGKFLGPFGDATLRDDLARSRVARDESVTLGISAWVGLAITSVVGFALAVKFGHSPANLRAISVASDGAEPWNIASVRLVPAQWYLHQTKIALVSGPLLVGTTLVIMVGLFSHELLPLTKRLNSEILIGYGLVLVAALIFAVVHALRFMGRTLIISGTGVSIEDRGKIIAHCPLNAVLISPISILVGSKVLVYRQVLSDAGDGKWIYDRFELERALFSRLTPLQSQTLGQFQLSVLKRFAPWKKGFLLAVFLIMLVNIIWALGANLF
ncbi:hypothetical protein [Rhizobacter sp. Root404]|uniref:hypothetical protein n=1 Tax=Rhizobacter sp. Root404 TaxID=1736528 RepID=UPI000A67FDB0|nr:hypothetical protein [Rhizobacter sp. Root404]